LKKELSFERIVLDTETRSNGTLHLFNQGTSIERSRVWTLY